MTNQSQRFRALITQIVFAATVFLTPHAFQLQAQETAQQLITEMGCAGCHTTLPYPHSLKEKIPDLTQAGSRYHEGYLFNYLRNPERVRRHLGSARMPNFQLTEEEALALTQYLATQQKMPDIDLPDKLEQDVPRSLQINSADRFTQFMNKQALCINCHSFEDRKAYLAVKLDNMGARLKPGFLKRYLAAPDAFGIKSELMPAQFYQPSTDGGQRIAVGKNPAQRINRIVGYLQQSGEEQRVYQQKTLEAALKKYPDANVALGKKIFAGLNCAGCHQAEVPAGVDPAPDLMITGSRVKETWLKKYLIAPYPLRKAGYRPGDGSRMPRFEFSRDQIELISEYLMQQKTTLPKADYIAEPSPSQKRKARTLLADKLSCLGCHKLDGKGGLIGPDLSLAGARLQPDYIDVMIDDPQRFAAHSVMPKILMPASTRKTITSMLAQQGGSTRNTDMPRLKELFVDPVDSSKTAKQYAFYCAPCHGENGNADGFNAMHLPQKPTSLADKNYMSTRNDGTIYDGIYAGGYILDKHHFMPPWQTLFNDTEIRDLVAFVRKLCNCEEPDWANDKKERDE